MRLPIRLVLLAPAVLLLTGCSEDPAAPAVDPYPDVVVFRDDVKVFDGADPNSPFSLSNKETFDFSVSWDPANPVCKEGDIIYRRPTADDPTYYFRRITGISNFIGLLWKVSTEQAELGDAIEYCRVAERVPLSLAALEHELPTEGVTLDQNSFGLGNFRILDAGMECESEVELVIDRANLNMADATIFVEVVVENRELVYFHVENDARNTLNCDVRVDASVACSYYPPPKTIYSSVEDKKKIKPIVVQAGPIPLVFVPVITVAFGVDFALDANFSQTLKGAGGSVTTDMGFTYDAHANPSFSGFNNSQGTGTEVALNQENSFNLLLRPYLTEQIKLMLYGVVGPTLKATQYIELNVWEVHTSIGGYSVLTDVCGDVWIGNKFEGGLDIGILDQSIVSWNYPLRDDRKRVYDECYSDSHKLARGAEAPPAPLYLPGLVDAAPR